MASPVLLREGILISMISEGTLKKFEMEESLVKTMYSPGWIKLSTGVIVTVVERSDISHFFKFTAEELRLNNSIHSGSPEEGAYIISLTTRSL